MVDSTSSSGLSFRRKISSSRGEVRGKKSASQIILGIEQSSDKVNRAKVRIKLNRGAISGARGDKVVGGGSFFSCDAMPCHA